MKKQYYAFVGQNASCGTPNPITGRRNTHGDNYVFDSKDERDEFVDNFWSYNPSKFCVACSKRKLRGYNLGMSVREFEEDLPYCLMTKVEDSDGNVRFERVY